MSICHASKIVCNLLGSPDSCVERVFGVPHCISRLTRRKKAVNPAPPPTVQPFAQMADGEAPTGGKPKRNFATERKQKIIFQHPVFAQEYDFKASHGMDVSEEQMFQLKKIFAIGNVDHSGIIGRRQFKDLMSLLGMDPTQEELDQMLDEMDENGDGQIEFDELATAMLNTYDAELIAEAADTPLGSLGTKAWSRGEILWSCNSNLIVACCGVVTALLVFFQFILVPLTLAYFTTFLLIPLMNVFEQRPLQMRGKSCCEPARDEEGNVSFAAGCAVGKMPHGTLLFRSLVQRSSWILKSTARFRYCCARHTSRLLRRAHHLRRAGRLGDGGLPGRSSDPGQFRPAG